MKHKKIISILCAVLIAITGIGFVLNSNKAHAVSITNVTVGLSSDTASATGVTATITFTNTTNVLAGGRVEISLESFTGTIASTWTGGAGDPCSFNSGGSSTGFARFDCTGTLTAGSQSIALTGLTNPSSNGNYNVSVVTTTMNTVANDMGSGLAYIGNANDVTVDAVVATTLDLEIYAASTGGTTTNVCHLGALSPNVVNTCSYYLGVATNNTGGLLVQVTSDGALRRTSPTALDYTNTTGVVNAGSEEYGFVIATAGALTAAGSYGTPDQVVPTSAQDFAGNTAIVNSVTGSDTRTTVTHKASMSLSTQTGSYSHVVTYTAYTK